MDPRSLVPLAGRILVTPPKFPANRDGDLIALPDNSRRRDFGLICQILKIGPDTYCPGVEEGDWVFIPEFAGIPLADTAGKLPFEVVGAGDLIAKAEDPAYFGV